VTGLKIVELTDAEKALLEKIDFEPSQTEHDAAAIRASGEAACALTKSLTQRKAIPEIRLRWFTEAKHNIGGHGASRQEIFERNGRRGEDILRHPHFLKDLHYFLFGPDLPAEVIDSFLKKVEDCGMVTSGDIIPLGDHAKQQPPKSRQR